MQYYIYIYINIRVFLSLLDVARPIAIIDNRVASSCHPFYKNVYLLHPIQVTIIDLIKRSEKNFYNHLDICVRAYR